MSGDGIKNSDIQTKVETKSLRLVIHRQHLEMPVSSTHLDYILMKQYNPTGIFQRK
jgi:hypothetical protein